MFGSKVFANSSRDWTRSVRTIGVHPAAWAARAVTRPIGPAPLYISEDPEGIEAVVMIGWSNPAIPPRHGKMISRRANTQGKEREVDVPNDNRISQSNIRLLKSS